MEILGTTVIGIKKWYYMTQVSWEELKESLHDALKKGDANAITTLHQAIQERVQEANLSPCQIFDLLSAKDSDGNPGLYVALQNGHAEVIHAYKELLVPFAEKIQPEQLVELLMAKNGRGISGLYMGVQTDHAEAIYACKRLFHAAYKALPAGTQVSCVKGFFDALEASREADLCLLSTENFVESVQFEVRFYQYLLQIDNWLEDFQQEETGQRNEENVIPANTRRIKYSKTLIEETFLKKARERRNQGNWLEAYYMYEKLVSIPEVDQEIKGEAAYQLGKMYSDGKDGIDKNEQQANAWFEQAYQYSQQEATQARAAFALGESYSALSLSSSVTLDKSEEKLAREWYQKALSHKHPEARQKINDLTFNKLSSSQQTSSSGEDSEDNVKNFYDEL